MLSRLLRTSLYIHLYKDVRKSLEKEIAIFYEYGPEPLGPIAWPLEWDSCWSLSLISHFVVLFVFALSIVNAVTWFYYE